MQAAINTEAWDADTAQEDIAGLADQVRLSPELKSVLIPLLPERHPIYRDRGENQVARIRGYLLASFAYTGLPDGALPYVLDELENSRNAYMVAAAARALRAYSSPTVHFARYLFKAFAGIRYMDDAISLDEYRPSWPLQNYTTAQKEILLTLQWMRGYARGIAGPLDELLGTDSDAMGAEIKNEIEQTLQMIRSDTRDIDTSCCDDAPVMPDAAFDHKKDVASISDIILQDQSAERISYRDFFEGGYSVVAFFYTRCGNPNKCSLTVTKMAQLIKELQASGIGGEIKTAIITYDPGYDNPERLRSYGENRSMEFDDRHRAFRMEKEEFKRFNEYFELGVNYSGSIVNQHRLELYILDKTGAVLSSYTRLQWDIAQVIQQLKDLAAKKETQYLPVKVRDISPIRKVMTQISSVLIPVLIAFFPKCPICWAAYLSALGITGINTIPYSPWMVPALIAAMGINLAILARGARRRNGYAPFLISLSGAVLLISSRLWLQIPSLMYVGILLVATGAMLNSLPYRIYIRIRGQMPVMVRR